MFLAQTSPATTFTADDVLGPYIYVFYAAFLISWALTPVLRHIAIYYNIVDQPGLRKIHKRPVAYLGGVAVFIGWICGLASSQFLRTHFDQDLLPHVQVYLGVVVGACVIVVLGLWDDIKAIRPKLKIAGQIVAAGMLLSSKIGWSITENFLKPIFDHTQYFLHWAPSPEVYGVMVHVTSVAVVVSLVVFCCNATNLMDGLDGLCGGVTALIAGGFLILATHLAIAGGMDPNYQALRVVLALALLGGVLGFVPYNFNPASIFMGDTGSMFLGFACATLILLMGDVGAKWMLAALVMFALPVLDTSLAFARRYANKRPLFSADKHHFHHQLVARGLSVRKAVLLSYGLTIFFVCCGIAIVFVRTRFVVAFYLVLFCSIIVAAYKMGMVHERPLTVSDPKTFGPDDMIVPTSELEAGTVMQIDPTHRQTTKNL